MSDILDEAKDDYVYNRRIELFKKALPIVAILTVITISIISVKEWYISKHRAEVERNTEILFEELTGINLSNDDRIEILQSLAKVDGSIGDISKFRLATYLIRNGKLSDALEELTNIINNSNSKISVNLAKTEYASLLLDQNELTDKQKSMIQTYLSSIDKSQPLYENAQIYSGLYNIKIGNSARAKEIAQQLLQSESLSEAIRMQAESILSYTNETK